MKTDITAEALYPHPIEHVWRALTSAEALAAWLMPNDFAPRVGHRFTFRTKPAPAMGFDGTVHCEVLEIDAPTRMVWSWAGGKLETTLTFTLTAEGPQSTRLHLHQIGFHGLAAQLTRRILQSGFTKMLDRRLPAYLASAPEVPGCAS